MFRLIASGKKDYSFRPIVTIVNILDSLIANQVLNRNPIRSIHHRCTCLTFSPTSPAKCIAIFTTSEITKSTRRRSPSPIKWLPEQNLMHKSLGDRAFSRAQWRPLSIDWTETGIVMGREPHINPLVQCLLSRNREVLIYRHRQRSKLICDTSFANCLIKFSSCTLNVCLFYSILRSCGGLTRRTSEL